MRSACNFRIGSHIAFCINYITKGKVILYRFSKSIKRTAVNKTPIGNHRDYTILINPIHCPTIESCIHIIHYNLVLGRSIFDIRFFYAFVYSFIKAIGVLRIVILLLRIIRRIANYNAYLFAVLFLNAFCVFTTKAKKIFLLAFIT